MIRVGLVVEGPHDLIMLQPILEREFHIKHGETVQFTSIQPLQDATGNYSAGGWTRVMAWCLRNSGEKLSSLFVPLFEGDETLDVIVIHLDGDALDLIRPHVGVQLPGSNATINQRMAGLETAVVDWLEPTAADKLHLVMAFPTMQTESWILAAANDLRAGEVHNAKDIFREDHPPKTPLSPFYHSKVSSAAAGFSHISARCQSYQHFESGIASVQW